MYRFDSRITEYDTSEVCAFVFSNETVYPSQVSAFGAHTEQTGAEPNKFKPRRRQLVIALLIPRPSGSADICTAADNGLQQEQYQTSVHVLPLF